MSLTIFEYNFNSTLFVCNFMQKRQRRKETVKHSNHNRLKVISPEAVKPTNEKNEEQRRQFLKVHQRTKLHSKQNSKQFKNSLFNSVQDLPSKRQHLRERSPFKFKEEHGNTQQSNNKIQDSTASRQFRLNQKYYDHPNDEYFGSRYTSNINHHRKKKSKSDSRNHKGHASRSKLVKTLQKKIKDYRRLDSKHKSESDSMKSEVSEQELRRLHKLQSMQKMQMMEQIIGIEEKMHKHKKKV